MCPPALLGAGHPGVWLFPCPSDLSSCPLAGTSMLARPQAGWQGLGFRPRWCGLCVTGTVWPGQSSLGSGLPVRCFLARAVQGLWRLAAFWLSKGGREGCASGAEGNGAMGAGWHLGAVLGLSPLHGQAGSLPIRCLCSSRCCCGPSICCQELVAPRCSRGRSLPGWREPSGAQLLQPPAWLASGGKAVQGRAAAEGWEGQGTVNPCARVPAVSLFCFMRREVRAGAAALGSQLMLVEGSDSSRWP